MIMNKQLFGSLLFLVLLFLGSVASAQCYEINRKNGIEAYNKGDKKRALDFFENANKCSDKPKNNDLDHYIRLCQQSSDDRDDSGSKKDKKPKEYTLDVDGYTSLNKHFEATGGSIRLYVHTNASSWTISSSSSWYTAKKDGNAIDLTVKENQGTESRNGTCYVNAKNRTVTINISQDAGRTYLQVDGKSSNDLKWELKATTSDYYLTINTNASSYSVRNYPSWVEVTSKSDERLSIKVQENNSAVERTGTMVISAGDVSTKVTLVQKAADCYLMVDGKTARNVWNISHAADNYNAYILTNAPSYSVTETPSWISIIDKKPDTLKVHVEANPSSSPRQGTIGIDALNKSFTLTVNQKGKPASRLLVDGKTTDRSYTPTASGGSYTFTVSTDQSYFYVDGRPSWITVNKNTSSFEVYVQENVTSRSRSATLLVKAGDSMVRLVFNQSGVVETDLPEPSDYSDSKSKSSKKTHHNKAVDWSWNLSPKNYLGGLSFGYTNSALKHYSIVNGSSVYDWKGNYAWGKLGENLNGLQVGFHIQRYTDWTLGVGIYTGAFFNYYFSWNKTEDWITVNSWGYNFTNFKEFSATVPLHIYFHLPILVNNLGLFAHAGPDVTYYWGAMYKDNREINRNMEPLYPMSYDHNHFSVGLSVGLGLHISQFEMEFLTGTGLNSFGSTDAKSYINQFAIRISYLFHEIN